MEGVIVFAAIAVIMLVISGILLEKGKMDGVGIFLLLFGVLILIVVGMEVRVELPTGQPAKIEDGIYDVRVVGHFYEDNEAFVGVLILKEEGKPAVKPLKYGKILMGYFDDIDALETGKEITIEIQPHKTAKKAVIKK